MMTTKQTYMPFFYDWLKPLSALNRAECAELIFAMVNYHQNGGEIPEFTGMTGVAADFIFPQLERAKEVSEIQAVRGHKGGVAKRDRSRNKQKCDVATNTNTNTTTTTNTTAITTTNTNNAVEDGIAVVCDDIAVVCDDMDVSVSEQEDRFNIFWENYPKKQNKKSAKQMWDRLHPDNALLERMLTALEWQKKSPAWTAEGGRYIPLPSSWLYQSRWEDERAVVPAKQTSSQSSFDTDELWEAAIRRSMMLYENCDANGADDPYPPI